MIRERGYTEVLCSCDAWCSLATGFTRSPFATPLFSGRAGTSGLGPFRRVSVGRARRRLSCFLITLSYSRALYLEFFFDQSMENFLRGHVHAFHAWSGQPRILLYDNLRSACWNVAATRFTFIRDCWTCARLSFRSSSLPGTGSQSKRKVERAVLYVRESFWAGRTFTTLEELNRQAFLWRDQVAHQRPWPDDDSRTVEQVFTEEQPRLLPLPTHPFETGSGSLDPRG